MFLKGLGNGDIIVYSRRSTLSMYRIAEDKQDVALTQLLVNVPDTADYFYNDTFLNTANFLELDDHENILRTAPSMNEPENSTLVVTLRRV